MGWVGPRVVRGAPPCLPSFPPPRRPVPPSEVDDGLGKSKSKSVRALSGAGTQAKAQPAARLPTHMLRPAHKKKKKKKRSEPLAWIDMEMTGLDPRRDQVLEIACIFSLTAVKKPSPPAEDREEPQLR